MVAVSLLDARGVVIEPGDPVIVVLGAGDGARPYFGYVMGVNAGARGRVVRKTSSGYPYINVHRHGPCFERPERIIVLKELPHAD